MKYENLQLFEMREWIEKQNWESNAKHIIFAGDFNLKLRERTQEELKAENFVDCSHVGVVDAINILKCQKVSDFVSTCPDDGNVDHVFCNSNFTLEKCTLHGKECKKPLSDHWVLDCQFSLH